MVVKSSEKNNLILISLTVFLSYLAIWFLVSLSRIQPLLMNPDNYFSSYLITIIQHIIIGIVISSVPYAKIIKFVEEKISKNSKKEDNNDIKENTDGKSKLPLKSLAFTFLLNIIPFIILYIIELNGNNISLYEPMWSPTTYSLIVFLVFLWSSSHIYEICDNGRLNNILSLVLLLVNSIFVYVLCRQFIMTFIIIASMVVYLIINVILRDGKRGFIHCACISLSSILICVLGMIFSGHWEKFQKWLDGTLVDKFYVDDFLRLKLLYIRNTGGTHPFASVNTYFGVTGLLFMAIFFTIIVWMAVTNCTILYKVYRTRMNINMGMYIFFILWFVFTFLSDIELFPAPGLNFIFIRYAIVGMTIMVRNNLYGFIKEEISE